MTCAARSDEWGYGYRHPMWFWHPGWIVLMILGFVFWWPVGLAILAFTIWGRRMGCWSYRRSADWQEHWQEKMDRMRAKMERFHHGGGWAYSSGNRAFDEYRSDTLKRLEEEQKEFREFLARLRMAKDKAEFDQFMAERRNRPEAPPPPPPPPQS
ncbi:MAG TPA: DUF2852 domain-containing protein [Xanthobacteraceae bacterium]|jgi:hypothetical protein|nr:DUF2852 domain-containing protein [Xanthobacteraceae bacterium]